MCTSEEGYEIREEAKQIRERLRSGKASDLDGITAEQLDMHSLFCRTGEALSLFILVTTSCCI